MTDAHPTAEHQDIDPFGVHSDEYNTWWRAARRKGWKLPVNNAFPDHSWLSYWQAMDRYEHGESDGKPVPPHRSGHSEPVPERPLPIYIPGDKR